ncbi:MAG: autotransporter-associated beta strand repeat-containing protein, partial [Verrucomicrobiales bacterium]|nr:autotransporter-associated beta strand repeat-containing protein [Verrucomicrobiales bacterium]
MRVIKRWLTVATVGVTVGGWGSAGWAQRHVAAGENVRAVLNTTEVFVLDGDGWWNGAALTGAAYVLDGGGFTIQATTPDNNWFRLPSGASTITLTDVVLTGLRNSTVFYADNGGGTLNLDGVTFYDNHRTSNGRYGAAITVENNRVVTVNGEVSFVNNTGYRSSAGAVMVSGGTLRFTGSVYFEGNATGHYGGAVSLDDGGSGGGVFFDGGVTFKNNRSELFAGALDVWGQTGQGVYFNAPAVFDGNYVLTNGDTGTNTYNSSVISRGGAINLGYIGSLSGTSAVISFYDRAEFVHNRVMDITPSGNNHSAYGGAISAYATSRYRYYINFYGAVVMDGNFAYSAIARGNGGAIYYDNRDATLNVGSDAAGSWFTNNYAKDYGGAIYLDGGIINLNATAGDITFQGNRQGASFTGTGAEMTPVADSGAANAIFLGAEGTINLTATGTHQIRFYDPIDAADNSAVTINKNGDGEAVFTTYPSNIRVTTNVNEGGFRLADGVVYGIVSAGTFTVAGSGTVTGDDAVLRARRVNVSAGGSVWVEDGLFQVQTGSFALGAGGVIGGSGTLAVTDAAGAGVSISTPAGGNVFYVDTPASGTLWITSPLIGAGKLVKRKDGVYVVDSPNTHGGGTQIDGGVIRLLIGGSSSPGLGAGALAVNSGGTLLVTPHAAGDYILNNIVLAGGGLIEAALTDQSSVFTAANLNAFSGTLRLRDSTYTLPAASLANAFYVTSTGNFTPVHTGTASLRGLGFESGTMRFATIGSGSRSDTFIAVSGTLDVSQGGQVQIDDSAANIDSLTAGHHTPLLSQDDLGLERQLASAPAVLGDAANLRLTNHSGLGISATRVVELTQVSATAEFDGTTALKHMTLDTHSLNTGRFNDGLYIGAKLTRLDLLAGKNTILDGDRADVAGGADFKALVTGAGNLWINAARGITLANGANSYTGTTVANTGTLTGGAANVIASSTALVVRAGAAFDTGTFAQTVNHLTGAGLVRAGAALTVHAGDATTFAGVFSGTGAVVKTGAATLTLTGSSVATGLLTIGAGTVSISGTAGAWHGDLDVGATLEVSRADAWHYGGALTGGGLVLKRGAGDWVLGGASGAFAGTVSVAAGRLLVNGRLGGPGMTLGVAGGGTLGGTGTLGGRTTVSGGVLQPGADGVGTLTLGHLTIGGNGVLALRLGQVGVPGGALNDLLHVNGEVTLNGALVNVSLAPGGALGIGKYRLIDYDGALIGDHIALGTVSMAGADPDNFYLQTSVAAQINLVYTGSNNVTNPDDPNAFVHWDGGASGNLENGVIDGGGGVWQAWGGTAGGQGNDNWTTVSGTLNAPWKDGGHAVFGGAASGTVSVDDSKGGVTVSGLRFTRDGYLINGDTLTISGTDSAVIATGTGTLNVSATIAASLSGNAGITKDGAGTLTLTGNNSFSGESTVSAGKLLVNGSNTSGAQVNSGILGGFGVIGGTVSVASGGTLAAGDIGAAGKLTVGGLDLANGSVTAFDLADTNIWGGANDWLSITGNLTVTNGAVLRLNGSGLAEGLYHLATYGGTLGYGGFTLDTGNTGLSVNDLYVQTSFSGTVNLINTGTVSGTNPDDPRAYVQWDGGATANKNNSAMDGGSGAWQAWTGNDNWTTVSGSFNAGWKDGGYAVFGGTSGGTVSVDNSAGGVTFSGLRFTRDGYLITGDPLTISGTDSAVIATGTGALDVSATIAASISGSAGVTKEGQGTLLLTGNNSFTGNSTVSAGKLLISGSNASGAQVNGGILGGAGVIGGTVSVANGGTLAAGDIGAAGKLTVGGLNLANGSVTAFDLASTNTWGGANDWLNVTGNLTVANGAVLHLNGSGLAEGLYHLATYGGTLGYSGFTLDVGNTGLSVNDIYVQTSFSGTVNLINTGTVSGTNPDDPNAYVQWDGGAATSKNNSAVDGGNGTWQAWTGNDNWTTVSGSFNAGWKDGGYAVFGGASGTVSVDNSAGGVTFSGLRFTRDGYLINGDPLTISGTNSAVIATGTGALNVSATIAASLSGNAGITKEGQGTLFLTGNNSFSGESTVSAGKLLISGSNASGAQVNGGVLGGAGVIGGTVSVAGGGTLTAGDLGAAGKLTVGGLDLANGSVTAFDLASTNTWGGANDWLNVTGNLTVANGAVLHLNGSGLAEGLYHLATYGGTLGYDGFTLDTGNTGLSVNDIYVQTSFSGTVNLINTGTVSGTNPDDPNAYVQWDGGSTANKHNSAVDGDNGAWQAWPGNDNWTTVSGSFNAGWKDGGYAVFGGASGTVSVDNSAGGVTFSGLRFTRDGYLITGDTLTISGTNGAVIATGTGALNVSATIAANISGNAGVTKDGAGTLTLAGNNDFSGESTVSAGKLLVNGSNASGAQVNGGLLGGVGALNGTVSVASGGTLAAGDLNVAGKLTVGGLDLANGSVTAFDLANTNTWGGANDWLNVTGNLTVANGAVLHLNGSGLAEGLYHLATYGGTLGYSGFTLDMGNTGLLVNDIYVQTSFSGTVNLINTGTVSGTNPDDPNAYVQWDGGATASKNNNTVDGGSGTWQAWTGNDNWTTVSGSFNAGWKDGGYAVFGGTSGTVSVDNSAGGVTFSGLRFISDGYLITGDTLTISGTNSAVIATGTGTLNVSATIAASISGSAGVTKEGAGTLTLVGNNSFSGESMVSAGKLLVSGSNASGAQVNGGILGGTGVIGGTVSVASGGTLAAGDLGAAGKLTVGGLNLANGSVTAFDLASTNTWGGANDWLNVTSNLTVANGAVLRLNGSGLAEGLYHLVTYGGTLGYGGFTLDVGSSGLSVNDLYVQTSFSGTVNLINTGTVSGTNPDDPNAYVQWDGGASSASKNNSAVDGGSG